jgi:flagellar basal-body rod protein FlgG
MIQSGYTAALGLKTEQTRVDAIANNIANIDTIGYKSTKVDFKDALYEAMQDPSNPSSTKNLQRGSGVVLSSTSKVFTQGTPQETGEETDMYIDGKGFFTVQSPDGNVYYTRDGSFSKSVESDGTYLTTAKGDYVLDTNGNKIQLQGSTMNVSESGQISVDANSAPYATIGVVTFSNQQGLSAVSDNLYAKTASSGEPAQAGSDTHIEQKSLEGSNVDLGTELTRLVRAQRAFSLVSRALTTADEMDSYANQMR